MAEAKKRLLTYAGLKALEDELENLKVVKRKEVAGKIKEAREQGDLSENAEYDAAKDEQRDIEARIEELEAILKNAEVVVEDEVDLDKINVGCTVKVFDITFDEEMEFKIVGSTEANSHICDPQSVDEPAIQALFYPFYFHLLKKAIKSLKENRSKILSPLFYFIINVSFISTVKRFLPPFCCFRPYFTTNAVQ